MGGSGEGHDTEAGKERNDGAERDRREIKDEKESDFLKVTGQNWRLRNNCLKAKKNGIRAVSEVQVT